jgi:hypothetical protein
MNTGTSGSLAERQAFEKWLGRESFTGLDHLAVPPVEAPAERDELRAAAMQARFALRELLPHDPDVQMTLRMLDAALDASRAAAPPLVPPAMTAEQIEDHLYAVTRRFVPEDVLEAIREMLVVISGERPEEAGE